MSGSFVIHNATVTLGTNGGTSAIGHTGVVPGPGSGTVTGGDSILVSGTFPTGISFYGPSTTFTETLSLDGEGFDVSLVVATTVAPGVYTIPYLWLDTTSGATSGGSFTVTVIYPVTLGSAIVAPGNSAAVPVSTQYAPTGSQVAFSFSCPPGLSVPWSSGFSDGIIGITVNAAEGMAPGVYSVPVTITYVGANMTAFNSVSVTVTDQQYTYSLAAPNQINRALGRLTSAFRNQTNVRGVLTSLLVGVPELTNVFWQIINGRILSNLVLAVAESQPTGMQIDVIGGLVGELRQGRVDASYLPAVLTRIRVNRSKGTAEDIIQVANLLQPGADYEEFPIMAWVVTMYDVVTVAVPTIAKLLGQAKAIGSRGLLEYSVWPTNENLVLDYTAASPVAAATVLDYTVASPVSGAGFLTGLTTATPS